MRTPLRHCSAIVIKVPLASSLFYSSTPPFPGSFFVVSKPPFAILTQISGESSDDPPTCDNEYREGNDSRLL